MESESNRIHKLLWFLAATIILAVVYTIAITRLTYGLADELWMNFGLFALLIFFLSLAIIGIIARLLHTGRFKNIKYAGLSVVVLSILILVAGLPPIQLSPPNIYLMFFILLGIAWLIVIILSPKLRRSKRNHWVLVPLMLFLAIMVFHHVIPQASCTISGGAWLGDGVLGQAWYCRYTYPDGGQACESSDECLGGCIVTDWPTNEPSKTGICKSTTSPFGCYASIEHQALFVCSD
jgi:hypothetical protein